MNIKFRDGITTPAELAACAVICAGARTFFCFGSSPSKVAVECCLTILVRPDGVLDTTNLTVEDGVLVERLTNKPAEVLPVNNSQTDTGWEW